jgi:hypothetical protein
VILGLWALIGPPVAAGNEFLHVLDAPESDARKSLAEVNESQFSPFPFPVRGNAVSLRLRPLPPSAAVGVQNLNEIEEKLTSNDLTAGSVFTTLYFLRNL